VISSNTPHHTLTENQSWKRQFATSCGFSSAQQCATLVFVIQSQVNSALSVTHMWGRVRSHGCTYPQITRCWHYFLVRDVLFYSNLHRKKSLCKILHTSPYTISHPRKSLYSYTWALRQCCPNITLSMLLLLTLHSFFLRVLWTVPDMQKSIFCKVNIVIVTLPYQPQHIHSRNCIQIACHQILHL